MKLCDMTQAYTKSSGGIRTYIERKRDWLLEHTGWEHVLIIPGERDEVERDGRTACYTVQSPYIPNCEPYRVVLNLDKVHTILLREQPDIIELGSGYTLPWAAFRYRKHHDCRIAGFYHTDYPTAYVHRFMSLHFGRTSALAARSIAAEYVRMVYSRCDITIAPSRLISRRLGRYGVPDVLCRRLGVDTTVFHPMRRSGHVREGLGIAPGDLMLIYAGRLDIEKRPDILADAVALLPDGLHAKLVMVGDGPLKQPLESGPVRDRLVLLPFSTDRERLAELLASADIYVTAGAFETFGLSVLEAQASGLPVAGVRAGALPERVSTDTGALCRPDSPEDMARCIETIARGDYRRMGKAARRLAETYSWNRTFEELMNLYEPLAHGVSVA